jgi:predicted metal-dependent phosphoesterase TrpH
MAARLRELGFELDEEALDRRRAAGGTVGRPHLAEAVLSAPANAGRLRDEGLETVTDVIVAYLIEDRPAFAGRTMPRIEEAINLVHEHGGVAIWAHPFWDVEDPSAVRATFERYVEAGVDGIEAFYVTHDEEQTRFAAGLAEERGLLRTGSADFHGPGHRLFSRFLAFSLHGLEPDLGGIAVV